MTLRASPGMNPDLSAATDAELSAISTGYLEEGELFFSEATGYFLLRKNSTATPAAGLVLTTWESAGGTLPGRLLFTGIGPSGGGAAILPLSHEFFVDGGTTTPTAQQNGSIAQPFKTIGAAVDHVLTNALGASTIYISAGVYDEQLVWDTTAFDDLDEIVLMGEGLEDTIIRGTEGVGPLVWTPTATNGTGSFRFKGLQFVAPGLTTAVTIDATAIDSFADALTGITFEECLFQGSIRCTRVNVINFENCVSIGGGGQPGTAFLNCSRVLVRDSAFLSASVDGIALSYDSNDPEPEFGRSGYVFQNSSLIAPAGSIQCLAQVSASFDRTCSMITSGGLTGVPTTGSSTMSVTASCPISGSVAVTTTDDVASTFDFSYATIIGAMDVAKAAGAQVTTVKAFHSVFNQNGGDHISFTGHVAADLRDAIFDKARLVGDATASCRRKLYYAAQATAAADTTVSVPNPPFPDASYVVTPIPLATTATGGAPYVTGKAAASFHVHYQDGSVGTTDILVDPYT